MTNYYKAEQLVEQSTTSATFIDVPGTTLTFTPTQTSEIWMIFVSGVCRSSSTIEQSLEMRLTIGGAERDLWSHQITDTAAPNGGGFLIFDRITGTTSLQTVKVQYRALAGTCYANTLRVVAARVPDNADFQYYNSDAIVTSLGTNLVLGSLTFTPSSTGNYIILGNAKHREHPSGSTSQLWFEGPDAALHPDAPTGVYYSNARESWNPSTCVWRENLTAVSKTINIRFTSSGPGTQDSEHRYRKIMCFREDVWGAANYNLAATQTTTTGATFVQKNSVTTATPAQASDYLSLQTARISGNSTAATGRRAGELRIAGSAKMRTDHTISRDGSNTQGYHHTVGLAEVRNTASSTTYANGFLSPNALTIQCAESAIVVLRYPNIKKQTHQMMM